MITLNASGNSVTFTFDGNSTYLNDGTITVPKNSLALIVDESDMATFRKAASNDIFVSANIAEFGMTKAELESWYKANMVSSTGGGGGVTPEDLDISGKTLYKVYTVDDGTDFSGFSASSVRIHYNGIKNAYEEQITVRAKDASDNLAAITISLTATTASGITAFTISEIGDISNKISVSLVNGELVATVTDNDFKIVSVAYTNSTDAKNVTISFIVPFEIESGSTPNVVEEGVYNALESISDDVNAIKNSPSSVYANEAWAKSIRDLSWYPSLSGLTLEYSLLGSYNWEFVAQPLDDSIRYGKRVGESGTDRYLGVYASGDTHTVTANFTYQTYTLAFDYSAVPVRKAVMHLNQSYTGVLPTARAILSSYIDNSGTYYKPQWSYNSGTDSFTNTTSYTGITLTYDNVAKTVTLELDPSYKSIMTVDSYSRIAPSTALTQNNCYIGLVTIDTNSYKLQEALDNKQDILSAGTNITISGNVISANGVQVSSAITENDTNPVEGGALYDELRIENAPVETTLTFTQPVGEVDYWTANYPSGCTTLVGNILAYSTQIELYNNSSDLGGFMINCYDGVLDSVSFWGIEGTYSISGSVVTISYPNTTNVTRFRIREQEYQPNYQTYKAMATVAPTVLKNQVNDNTTALGGLKLVKISQSDYENLQNKDDDTLYVILGS